METHLYVSPREKLLLRRFAAGIGDDQIATEFGDKPSRIAAQRERLTEKFNIRTAEQLSAVADELAHRPCWKPKAQRLWRSP
jgi:DNA-binding CsgD family transcriptional regulator